MCQERNLVAKVNAGMPCGNERARGVGVGDANFKDDNLEEVDLTHQSTQKGQGQPEDELKAVNLENGVLK